MHNSEHKKIDVQILKKKKKKLLKFCLHAWVCVGHAFSVITASRTWRRFWKLGEDAFIAAGHADSSNAELEPKVG